MATGDLITQQGVQYEWNGFLFGTTTDNLVITLEGLDSMPEITAEDVDRNDDHGGFVGMDIMKSREIVMTANILRATHALARQAVTDLARIMQPRSDLQPFVFYRPGGVVKQCFVRPRGRVITSDANMADGAFSAALRWLAPDPRIYSLDTNSISLTLPVAADSDSIEVDNAGDFPTDATITITGAGSNPRITNAADDGRAIRFDLVQAAGTTLVFDTATRAATVDGASVYSARRNDNQWWRLQPGNNLITFARTATAASQTMTIAWRDAWL